MTGDRLSEQDEVTLSVLGCKILVDDRKPPWGIRHYYELDEHGREVGR